MTITNVTRFGQLRERLNEEIARADRLEKQVAELESREGELDSRVAVLEAGVSL